VAAPDEKPALDSVGADLALSVGRRPVTIEDVLAVARGERRVALDRDPTYREKLDRARRAVADAQARGSSVYGVSTGVGPSHGVAIPETLRDGFPHQLM
jgi:histidine ammonia-lyase